MLAVKYKLSGLLTKIVAFSYLPLFTTLKAKMLMELPEEKGVQTHFKEHLFSFTRRDER